MRRGVVIAELFEAEPPPPERLKPGQPGRSWRMAAPGFWVTDCKDGSRVAVNGGLFLVLKPGKVLT
jgi:hypothetical protein